MPAQVSYLIRMRFDGVSLEKRDKGWWIQKSDNVLDSDMTEIQPEKEKGNMEKDIFKILHDVKVAVRRPDSTSVNNVNLGKTKNVFIEYSVNKWMISFCFNSWGVS